jgi:hypothetical protein
MKFEFSCSLLDAGAWKKLLTRSGDCSNLFMFSVVAMFSLALKRTGVYEILQILSLTMFETTPINQLLTPPSTGSTMDFEPQQLVLL